MTSYELNSTAKENEALAAIGGTGFGATGIQLLKQLVVAAGVYRSSQFVGALDAYSTGLAGAWSARRRLLTSYTGPLVAVRRSSDDATLDIGATSDGSLDVVALLAFCGAGDGFVVTLYDQDGNNDYTQSTEADQPAIVLAGVLQTDDGTTPSIRCEAGPFLEASRFTGSAMTLYARQRITSDPPTELGAIISGIGADSAGANQDHFPFADGNIYLSHGSTARKSCGDSAETLTAAHSFTCVSETNNWILRINSTSFYSTATNTVGFTTVGTGGQPWIGKSSTALADGWFTEMAFYDAAHTITEWAGIEPIFQP